MITLDDADHQIIRLILLKLADMIENGELDKFVAAGFPDGLVDYIRALTASDICALSRQKSTRITLGFDFPALLHSVWVLRRLHDEEATMDYFVINGASAAMLRDLFRLSTKGIKDRRRYLLGSDKAEPLSCAGRNELPPEALRSDIERAWLKLQCKTIPLIKCYFDLHQKFPTLPLETLYATVNYLNRDEDGGK